MTTEKSTSIQTEKWFKDMLVKHPKECGNCTVRDWGFCTHLEYGQCKYAEPEKIISVRKSLVMLIALIISAAAFAQPAKTGYWVVTDTKGEHLEIVKTPNMLEVITLSDVQFPGNCFEIQKELNQWPPVFSVENGKKAFYVELKSITQKGKYRRISRRDFNAIINNKKQ